MKARELQAMEQAWNPVYQSSLYAFRPDSKDWFCFSLDGSVKSFPQVFARMLRQWGSLTLMTAWNPMSKEQAQEVNMQANKDLLLRLRKSKLPFVEAYGSSLPGVQPTWREEGFAVFAMERAQALEWGQSLSQRALVWADGESIGLLFCSSGKFIPCGMQRLESES